MTNSPPKLNPGQVSLARANVNTGHVLKTNGALYLGNGDTFETFESMALVQRFIKSNLADKSDLEFIEYDSNGNCIMVRNRFEKKEFRRCI